MILFLALTSLMGMSYQNPDASFCYRGVKKRRARAGILMAGSGIGAMIGSFISRHGRVLTAWKSYSFCRGCFWFVVSILRVIA